MSKTSDRLEERAAERVTVANDAIRVGEGWGPGIDRLLDEAAALLTRARLVR